MAFGLQLSSFLKPSAEQTPGQDENTSLKQERDEIFGYKKQAIALAQEMAAAHVRDLEEKAGRPLKQDEAAISGKATLVQYYQACVEVGKQNGLDEGQWNPRVFADLSGQKLENVMFNDPRKGAPSMPEIDKNYDGYDLDGDGQINSAAIGEFYDNICFSKMVDGKKLQAEIRNGVVDPLTSFNEPLADAKLEGITFNNMKEGETFKVGPGCEIKDAKMTNVKGGEFYICAGGHIDGFDISGAHAALTIESNASISNVTTDENTRILNLKVEKGGMIAHANFGEATISLVSEVQGAKFQNVQFGGNLNGVDFSNTTNIGLQLHNANLQGAVFNGASFQDATLNGQPLTTPEQLTALGAKIDANTTIKASEQFLQQAQANQAFARVDKEVMSNLLKGLSFDQTPPPQAASQPTPDQQLALQQQQRTAAKQASQQKQAADQQAAVPSAQTQQPQAAAGTDMSYYAAMNSSATTFHEAPPPKYDFTGALPAGLEKMAQKIELANPSANEIDGVLAMGFDPGQSVRGMKGTQHEPMNLPGRPRMGSA